MTCPLVAFSTAVLNCAQFRAWAGVAVAPAPQTAKTMVTRPSRSLDLMTADPNRLGPCLQPAPAPEQRQEPDARGHHAPHSEHPEGPGGGDPVPYQPTEVHPEETRDERERQEDRSNDGELLHHLVLAVADGGQVEIGRAAQQVAVGVDQVRDPDQVVVDVAEVVALVEDEARELGELVDRAGKQIALRRHDLSQHYQVALEPEQPL